MYTPQVLAARAAATHPVHHVLQTSMRERTCSVRAFNQQTAATHPVYHVLQPSVRLVLSQAHNKAGRNVLRQHLWVLSHQPPGWAGASRETEPLAADAAEVAAFAAIAAKASSQGSARHTHASCSKAQTPQSSSLTVYHLPNGRGQVHRSRFYWRQWCRGLGGQGARGGDHPYNRRRACTPPRL